MRRVGVKKLKPKTKKKRFTVNIKVIFKSLFYTVVTALLLLTFYFTIYFVKIIITEIDAKKIDNVVFLNQEELQYTKAQDIKKIIFTNKKAQSFFMLNINDLSQAISKNYPWIRYVKVAKIWPDTLNIYIKEYEPIAIWNKNFLVSYDGNIFNLGSNKKQFASLPWLVGDDAFVKDVLNEFLTWNLFFEKYDLVLKGVKRNPAGSLEFIVNPDILIKLGSNDIQKKLERFIKVYRSTIVSSRKIDYVDMRYDSGLALKFKEEQQPLEQDATENNIDIQKEEQNNKNKKLEKNNKRRKI